MTDLALFESLLSCNTVEELHAKTSAITQRMGFEHFLYGMQLQTKSGPPWQFILSGYPEDWVKHYSDAGYQNVDPVVKHCIQNVIPVVWDDFVSLRPAAKKVMDEAKDFGLATGMSCPLRGFGNEQALLSVAIDRTTRAARQDMFHELGNVQLLANYVHEAVRKVVLKKT